MKSLKIFIFVREHIKCFQFYIRLSKVQKQRNERIREHFMLNPSQRKGFSIQRMSKVKTLQNLEGKIFLDFFFFTINM